MEIVSTIKTAAHSAVEAVENPFLTIGARLASAWHGLESFFGHPYCAPPLQDALTTLHGVVADLAQEVAELRVPCPCKPAPTASTTAAAGDAGQAPAAATVVAVDAVPQAPAAPAPAADAGESISAEPISRASPQEIAAFREWQAARAAAALFAAPQA